MESWSPPSITELIKTYFFQPRALIKSLAIRHAVLSAMRHQVIADHYIEKAKKLIGRADFFLPANPMVGQVPDATLFLALLPSAKGVNTFGICATNPEEFKMQLATLPPSEHILYWNLADLRTFILKDSELRKDSVKLLARAAKARLN